MYEYTYIGQATNAVADPTPILLVYRGTSVAASSPRATTCCFRRAQRSAHEAGNDRGVECLFRIASVRYGDNGARAWWCTQRQTARGLPPCPWTSPLALASDVERDGIFDYDFDVVEYTDGRENQDAYVLLVSGERPDGDNTLFDTASTAGILSVVRCA